MVRVMVILDASMHCVGAIREIVCCPAVMILGMLFEIKNGTRNRKVLTFHGCRICMWIPDANTPPTPSTPHPLTLSDVINTGHRANIFSSKFLPNASHPTIVSAAGDSQIRVFDVERLERTVHGGPGDGELDGRSGPGWVLVLLEKGKPHTKECTIE